MWGFPDKQKIVFLQKKKNEPKTLNLIPVSHSGASSNQLFFKKKQSR
jgi:hypothetical protein